MDDPNQLAPISRAWWSGTLLKFNTETISHIVERLAYRTLQTHIINYDTQLRAWVHQIEILRQALVGLSANWQLLLEYPLLRLGRRLDAVLVTDRAIFVIEFKTLTSRFDTAARTQTLDYALDLHDFHAGSRDHLIVPILVAGTGQPNRTQWSFPWPGVCEVIDALPKTLGPLLEEALARIPHRDVDIEAWERAPYRPVPTIIEAATMLYARHGVTDIAEARADTVNLTKTTRIILDAIADAKRDSKYIIVFVTGIPGAGKTLCGLNTVFGADTGAAFLTGNLPLVHVLREALAQDAARNAGTIGQARQKTESAVQGLTGFVKDNVDRREPPHEHVIVFDEAQRAWDAAYGAQKFGLNDSEAALFLDIMRKHPDYAVVIALVGNGQEINTGEAGLSEWGRALSVRPDWNVHAAPDVLMNPEPRQRLFSEHKIRPNIIVDKALHLHVPIRSVRSAYGAPWVDAVLRGAVAEARIHAAQGIPFFITRSLSDMRKGLRTLARGQRRAGLVCSTGARRLVADGIWPDFPHLDSKAIANWFLNRWPDVRASDALEIPATQFACQGLELDYVGLCWGGDLVWAGKWIIRKFSGTKWQHPAGQDAKDFRINSYRVLLTRARYDTIIWIPTGNAADKTRACEDFDQTTDYLLSCGAQLLTEFENEAAEIDPVLF